MIIRAGVADHFAAHRGRHPSAQCLATWGRSATDLPLFKPLRDVEAQAVKRLIEQLTDFRVEFAFLHASEDHDWMVFDLHEEGRQDWRPAERWQRGKVKGEFVPDRGYAVPLGRSEILLTVTGPGQLICCFRAHLVHRLGSAPRINVQRS